MSNLSGTEIKDTYGGVLNIGPAGLTGSLSQVTDGDGNVLPFEVSNTTVNFTGIVTGALVGPTGPTGSPGGTGVFIASQYREGGANWVGGPVVWVNTVTFADYGFPDFPDSNYAVSLTALSGTSDGNNDLFAIFSKGATGFSSRKVFGGQPSGPTDKDFVWIAFQFGAYTLSAF